MENKQAFAKALRTIRKGKGLTQEDFSEISSRTYLSILERGLKSPTLEKIDELAKAMGVQPITIYPTVGIPTSLTLHDAHTRSLGSSTAVVYDEVGLHPEWLQHLDWLGSHVQVARYVKSGSVAWDLAGW